jgi:hypothetical protein
MVVLTFHVPTSYIVSSLFDRWRGLFAHGGSLVLCRSCSCAISMDASISSLAQLIVAPQHRHQEPPTCNLQCGRPSRASRLGRLGVAGRAAGGHATTSTNCEGLSGFPTPCFLLHCCWKCPGSRRVRTARTRSCYDLESHHCVHSKSATVCTSMPWSDTDLTSKSISCKALGYACKPTKNHLPLFPAIWYSMQTSKEEVGDFSWWIFRGNVGTGVADWC